MKSLAVETSSHSRDTVRDAPGPHTERHVLAPTFIGYQRQLLYKHDDGSYSAFGKADNQGNTW